jgi:hypothetical protein
MRLTAISAIAWVFLLQTAQATPSCMTQDEARVKYPRAHLYWHGPKKCWDNVPPGRRVALLKPKQVSEDTIDNIQERQEAERRLETCCWPTLTPFDLVFGFFPNVMLAPGH